jgi:hypothetical protein
MAVTVDRDLMPLTRDLPRQLGPELYLLADQKEGRCVSRAREEIQYRWSALGVRAVIERQRHPIGAGRERPGNAQRVSRGRHDWRKRVAQHARDDGQNAS